MKKSDVAIGHEHAMSRNAARRYAKPLKGATIVIPRAYCNSSDFEASEVLGGTQGKSTYGTSPHKAGWLCDRVFEDSERTKVLLTGSHGDKRRDHLSKMFVSGRHLICLADDEQVTSEVERLANEHEAKHRLKAEWEKVTDTVEEIGILLMRRNRNLRRAVQIRTTPTEWTLVVSGGYRQAIMPEALEALEYVVEDFEHDEEGKASLAHDPIPEEWKAWQVAAAWAHVADELGPDGGQEADSLSAALAFAGAGFLLNGFSIMDRLAAEVFTTVMLKELKEAGSGEED